MRDCVDVEIIHTNIAKTAIFSAGGIVFSLILLGSICAFFFRRSLKTKFFGPLVESMSVELENSATINIARQVAHDIRSPLSALNIVASTLHDVPESKRKLIGNAISRINQIANDLLAKGQVADLPQSEMVIQDKSAVKRKPAKGITELKYALESLLSKKQIQYSEIAAIRI